MVQRSEALYQGRIVGIETIYTVINGQQINIPEKVEELRKKSRNNELFCPCGCGTNLVLVAGDRNLREQHFREKHSEGNYKCTYKDREGKTSVWSKIVLKCWLDDKLQTDDVESRVSICDIDDTDRKYELTLLSRKAKVAVNYSRMRENLSDEKIDLLYKHCVGIRIIHVVDESNAGTNGQYPEWLMKVQRGQEYCLLLSIDGYEYNKARMTAVFYEKNEYGIWQEIPFASGKLYEYDISAEGELILGGKSLGEKYSLSRRAYIDEINNRIQRREEELARRRELERQQREAEEKRWAEAHQRREELEREREKEAAEAKRKVEEQERLRQEAEKRKAEEKKQCDEEVARAKQSGQLPQDRKLIDSQGVHWIQCEICGKIDTEVEFAMYGGPRKFNLGTCKECMKNKPSIFPDAQKKEMNKSTEQRNGGTGKCPICGGDLRERTGKYGKFLGCSNYPSCPYTRSMR